MRTLRTLWARVKGQTVQAREDEAFDEEIRSHIALLEERFRAQGMSAQQAAYAARRQFGNVAILKEGQRALRGILSPQEWARDLRFGMRMLAKRPALNAAMILALALGIGANTTVFSVVDAVLLRPLPYAHPERLVEVESSEGVEGLEGSNVSYRTSLTGGSRTTASITWSLITTPPSPSLASSALRISMAKSSAGTCFPCLE